VSVDTRSPGTGPTFAGAIFGAAQAATKTADAAAN